MVYIENTFGKIPLLARSPRLYKTISMEIENPILSPKTKSINYEKIGIEDTGLPDIVCNILLFARAS